MSEAPQDATANNRQMAVEFINKLKPLDVASASFLVLDDEGNTWRVEFNRQ